jgi:DNA repair exonuclease SbcCD ATPase subunit
MRGGLAAEAWRERFRALRDPLARLEAHLATMEEDLANTNPFERKEREKLEQRRTELRARLEALDEQANKAGVPHTWRQ